MMTPPATPPVIQVINNTQLNADNRSQNTLDNQSFAFAEARAKSKSKSDAKSQPGILRQIAGCGCLVLLVFFGIVVWAAVTVDPGSKKNREQQKKDK